MLRIGQVFVDLVPKVTSHLRKRGLRQTLLTAMLTAAYPVMRYTERLIWEVKLTPREPSIWEPGERLIILGPDNVDEEMTPQLRSFLRGTEAAGELNGVRGGDRLFIVATETEYLACSYIFFDTTRETRRHARIYGEQRNTPIIGMSFTSPATRGRGLYRRILNEMFRFLRQMNYDRAICEVHPRNLASNRASEAAGLRVCRELCDWAFLDKVFVQKVKETGKSRWRILWV
jgi:RimJ/RimL family protein N-acetyltransferase